jgi:Tfp pilus assembly protein PilE
MKSKKGISLIALIITIIVIIILAAIVIGVALNTPEGANRAKFASDMSEVQQAVKVKLAENYNQYITNPDTVDLNAGFTRISVSGAPESFNSFALEGTETGTIGYLVKLDTIKMENLTIGQEYKTATDVTFGLTDAFVYDSEGEAFYAKGYKYNDKIYYKGDFETPEATNDVNEIEIYTKEQLANIGKGLVVYEDNVVYNGYVVAAKGKWNYADTYTYKIMADIDLSGIANWEPIPEFKGSIQGNNHIISNLTIDRGSTDYVGLVSIVSGTGEIRDLKLTNINVKGGTHTSGLVGYFNSTGSINNCSVSGTVNGLNNVGGLIGKISSGTITRSYANGSINGAINIGGFIGSIRNSESNMEILECYFEGNVNGSQNQTGGFVGDMLANGKADLGNHKIIDCYSNANTITTGACAGGFIGDMEYGSISNCYSMGSVQAKSTVGGFAGQVCTIRTDSNVIIEKCYSIANSVSTTKDSNNNGLVGGFIGTLGFFESNTNYYKIKNNYSLGNSTSTDNGSCIGGFIGVLHVDTGKTGKLELINNYSTGKPTTTGTKGGFIAVISSSGTKTITYTNNFWDTTTSAISTTSGTATGRTTTLMKTASNFSTWSTSIWNIVDGAYPTLKWDFTNVWTQVGANPTLLWQ